MVPQTHRYTLRPDALHFHVSMQQNRPGRTAYYFTSVVRSERTAVSLRLQALPPQHELQDVPVPQAGAQQTLLTVPRLRYAR